MNLHIVPDNVFINKFYSNLQELNIIDNNKFVVRTNHTKLQYVKHNLPFSKPYTRKFDALTGDTSAYEKVFIHQFTPLLYRWVALNTFQELNWMVWGSDLYNLPSVNIPLYEELTSTRYFERKGSLHAVLYRLKVSLFHERYRKKAYAKVRHVLTWMGCEHEFALRHLSGLQAGHAFFFYENDVPYRMLDEVMLQDSPPPERSRPVYILGNSATPELNHIDAVALMDRQGVRADLWVPISYGDKRYARFLKKNLVYKGGEVRFIDEYLDFRQYLQLLNQADGLIMNNIRPQGYGNILMMMYMGKKIFLNEKNFSAPELDRSGLIWQPLDKLGAVPGPEWSKNKSVVTRLLSHDTLLKTYAGLFS